jgi:hypothetical protein
MPELLEYSLWNMSTAVGQAGYQRIFVGLRDEGVVKLHLISLSIFGWQSISGEKTCRLLNHRFFLAVSPLLPAYTGTDNPSPDRV